MKVTVNTEKEIITVPLSATLKESKLPAVPIIFLPNYLQTEQMQIFIWVRNVFLFLLFEPFSVSCFPVKLKTCIISKTQFGRELSRGPK